MVPLRESKARIEMTAKRQIISKYSRLNCGEDESDLLANIEIKISFAIAKQVCSICSKGLLLLRRILSYLGPFFYSDAALSNNFRVTCWFDGNAYRE
jgi:hypothetical protein